MEGRCVVVAKREREREREGGILDTPQVDTRERERRRSWRTRASLKTRSNRGEPFLRGHAGRSPSSSSVSAIELLTDSHRKRVRFAQQRRVYEADEERRREREKETARARPHTQSSPIRGSSGSQSASRGVRKLAAENKRRCQPRAQVEDRSRRPEVI